MKTIHLLPDHLIAQIAAGEVIERPAYAVKELIDNALDAKATDIIVELEDSGIKRMTITDNGIGMEEEDLLESFKLHTTSKIDQNESLLGIKTLGFRGEALASVAAISMLTIQSRPNSNSIGTRIEVYGGQLKEKSPVGMPEGTVIMVQDLFYTAPARRKFLKTSQTELRFITEVVASFALAYPAVRFTLRNNQKTILDLPPDQVKNRLEVILGNAVTQELLPVTYQDTYVSIQGFISRPQQAVKSTSKLYFYVNNRKVSDQMIQLAVKESFGTLLEESLYPVGKVNLTVPHHLVDVNVHPRKEQVSFSDSRGIFDAVKLALTQTLTDHNLTFANISWKDDPSTKSVTGKTLKKHTDIWQVSSRAKVVDYSDVQQFHNLYLVTPTKEGMLVIDQHAAHERILYQQFLDEFKKQQKKSQKIQLKKPVLIELSITEAQLLEEYLEYFASLGFDISHFQASTYKIEAVPQLFIDRNLQELLQEVLEDLAEDKSVKTVDAYSDKVIKYLACRSAIKAGEKLTKQQAKDLLQKLESTENNATCPHGRPTRIEISLHELDKFFKRI